MQKRRNIARTISLGILLLITAAVYWLGNGRTEPVDGELFSTPELAAIDSIVLHSAGENVALHFDGARWNVNGRYRADRNMIDVLFATLQQARPKRPVADRIRDSVTTRLDRRGVTVSLFKEGTLKKEFIAGGNAEKTQAWFMDPDDRAPYLMTIPGYRVYVSGILELDANGWRDKFVFGFNWRNFQRLDADFPASPENNFTITMDKDNVVSVNGLAATDTTHLNDFLDDVSLLTVTRYQAAGYADSLREQTPVMHLRVSDIAGRHYSLTLFSAAAGREYPGLVHETQPALFDPEKIQKIIRPRSYFMRK